MKALKWLLGVALIFVPALVTLYFVVVTLWKIFLTALLFLGMIRLGVFLLTEEKIEKRP